MEKKTKSPLLMASAMLVVAALFAAISFWALSSMEPAETGQTGGEGTAQYQKITQEEAKSRMDSGDEYILLDVRSQEEYDEKHIAGAIIIPVGEIEDRAYGDLTDRDALILVYCRSGGRSKTATEMLVELGYTNVKDFGGINTWPYETE